MAAGDSLSYRTRTAIPSSRPETHASRTMTLNTEELEELEAGNSIGVGGREEINGDTSNPVGTLKLRGGGSTDRKVKWDEDVIDNEGLGRKKSKVCCIYHRPRAFDESSSDESSDSNGSDDDGNNNSGENGNNSSNNHDHNHNHSHRRHHHHHHHHHQNRRSNSPNAYERQPNYKNRSRPQNSNSLS